MIIPVRFLSFYNVCGNVSYVDNLYDTRISRYVYVGLYNCFDNDCQGVEFAGYTYTDPYGDFCFWADSPVVVVAVWSDNPINTVMYAEDHELSEGDMLWAYYYSVLIRNYGFEDIEIPDEYLRADSLNMSGAFNILDYLNVGSEYSEYIFGSTHIPPKNVSVWDDLDDTRITSSFGSFYTSGDIPGYYFASRANYYENWDEWDRGVILHEYGHYVMYHSMDDIPETEGEWHFIVPVPGNNNLNQALSEGWANFLSAVILDDQIFVNSWYDEPFHTVHYYEYSVPDPGYYYDMYDYPDNPPMQTTVQFEGAHVPGCITVALWDLYDDTDDDNYYIGPTIWGHNNDHNSWEYWCGINEIWDVLVNFDPQPDNPDHNHCWNIYEFIHGWRTLGYPVDSTFKNIFEAHAIPVFIPGDFTDDGIINMFDITHLISYLYMVGPAPEHKSAADVNADCTLDIIDITYMIDCLYMGGPDMLVGCYNMYP